MPIEKKLSPRQRIFVNEYLVTLNATQSAIKAGYSKKTAQEQGSRLLSNVIVKTAIESATKKQEKRTEISADYVLKSLKEVAERCMQRAPVMVFDPVDRKMVQEKEGDADVWEFDSSGANKALELLGKHLSLFTDNHTLSGKGGGPIETKAVNDKLSAIVEKMSEADLLKLAGLDNGK